MAANRRGPRLRHRHGIRRRARVRARKIKRIGTALVDGLREQSKKSWATEHDNAGLSRLRRASMGTVATVIMQLQQHNGKRSGTNDDDLHIQHSVSKAATECVRRVVCVAACVEQGMCAVASRCSRVAAVRAILCACLQVHVALEQRRGSQSCGPARHPEPAAARKQGAGPQVGDATTCPGATAVRGRCSRYSIGVGTTLHLCSM